MGYWRLPIAIPLNFPRHLFFNAPRQLGIRSNHASVATSRMLEATHLVGTGRSPTHRRPSARLPPEQHCRSFKECEEHQRIHNRGKHRNPNLRLDCHTSNPPVLYRTFLADCQDGGCRTRHYHIVIGVRSLFFEPSSF